jgi:hypothetical protein
VRPLRPSPSRIALAATGLLSGPTSRCHCRPAGPSWSMREGAAEQLRGRRRRMNGPMSGSRPPCWSHPSSNRLNWTRRNSNRRSSTRRRHAGRRAERRQASNRRTRSQVSTRQFVSAYVLPGHGARSDTVGVQLVCQPESITQSAFCTRTTASCVLPTVQLSCAADSRGARTASKGRGFLDTL